MLRFCSAQKLTTGKRSYAQGSYGYPAYIRLTPLMPSGLSVFATGLSIALRGRETLIWLLNLEWLTDMAYLQFLNPAPTNSPVPTNPSVTKITDPAISFRG